MRRSRLLLELPLVFLLAFMTSVAIAQEVVLRVDRDTSTVSLINTSAVLGHVALYEITSDFGVIDPNGWAPLADSDASWRVLGSPTANKLTEIKETGQLQVSQGVPQALGAAFATTPAKLAAGFGVDVEDLRVQLYDPILDVLTTPEVVYEGEKIYNSLVVNVDTLTGIASIENESPFSVNLTGYTVSSSSGELNPSWPGIRALDPSNWLQAGVSSSQFASELNQNGVAAPLILAAGASVDLGFLYMGNGTTQDLTFEFILQDEEQPMSSVVKYSGAAFSGDADDDGDVDGADLLLLQRVASHQIPTWELNYGNGSSSTSLSVAVPEPNALLLALLGCALTMDKRSARRHML